MEKNIRLPFSMSQGDKALVISGVSAEIILRKLNGMAQFKRWLALQSDDTLNKWKKQILACSNGRQNPSWHKLPTKVYINLVDFHSVFLPTI